MKKYLQNAALLLSSLTFTGLICEGMFYFLNRLSPPPKIEAFDSMPNGERLDFFQYHPIYGFTGLPNIRKEFYGKYITHNPKGLRGPEIEYQKAEGTKRVVFLGDSQTWGFGVSDNETISYFASQMLNQKSGGATYYEAINLGANGYGIDQSYLRFITEGLRYQPDYVVFTYFADNDIWETASINTWGVEKPYMYEKESGTFCVSNIPPRRAPGWPSDNLAFIVENKFKIKSASVQIAGVEFDLANTQTATYFKNRSINASLFGDWGDNNLFAEVQKHVDCLESQPGPELSTWESKIELAVRLIDRIHKTAVENGADFFVITKPIEEDYTLNRQGHDYQAVVARLRQLGLKVIDPHPVGKSMNITREEMYIGFGHLSILGNKKTNMI